MTKTVEIGKKVASIKVPATSDTNFQLKDYKGKNVILYFYPKDNTPGCTTEGQDFKKAYKKLQALDTEVFGVSRDSLASHEKFKEKQNFPFELISDTDEKLCKQFDVIKMKNMYGKKHLGIERSTFLIDADGKLVKDWRKVRVAEHVKEVLHAVKDLD